MDSSQCKVEKDADVCAMLSKEMATYKYAMLRSSASHPLESHLSHRSIFQDMASSGNPPPPQDPTTADEYECLKYIIDTARTDTATTDVANKDAMVKVAGLTKIFQPMSMMSLHLGGHYAYRYIAPLNYTLLHLRRRLRNLPEGFGVKSNNELNADRKDDVQG